RGSGARESVSGSPRGEAPRIRLVLRQRRVDPIDPGEDAAGHVARLDPVLAEQGDGLGAAASHLAMHDDLGRAGAAGYLAEPLWQLAEGDQRGARNAADLEFPRL